jgi:glycosyltransferase involved in cell wall biosynthesis
MAFCGLGEKPEMTATRGDSLENCVLSVYPLTCEFQSRVGEIAGPNSISLRVAELRQHGTAAMLRVLRSRRINRVLLPIENDEGAQLLPVLKILASLIPSRGVYVLGSDLKAVPVPSRQIATSGLQLLKATAQGFASLRQAGREVDRLLVEERIDPQAPTRREVLFLNANLWFGVKAGGSVGHISGVINGLLDVGHPVLFASAGGRLLARSQAGLVPLAPPSHFGIPWEYNFYRFHFNVIEQLFKLEAIRDVGLIYQRLSICNYSGVELSRSLRKPLIIEYNGSEVWIARNWGHPLRSQELAEKVEAVNLRHAHLVVTISDVLRDALVERGVAPERIVTYPNCIDPVTFDPARLSMDQIASLRRRYGIAPDALVTTFVGTFAQWHGASVLARAVRKLLDDDGDWAAAHKLQFVFVGDGLKMREVRDALGPHLMGPRVTLTRVVPQDQTPLYLAASDILASPHVPNADGSRFFGSPTKLFEYMAMGKAIIASDVDQIGQVLSGSLRLDNLPSRTLVPSGEPPALLVAPGSVDEIAQGLKFLVERPEWRSALGTNARRLALAKYTWRHHVEAIMDRARHLGLVPAGIGP